MRIGRLTIASTPIPTCAVALILAVGLGTVRASAQDAAVAIRGASVETGAKAGRIDNAVIVIENGKIAKLGPAAEVAIPAAARVVDLKGQTILPGLIDPLYVVNVGGSDGDSDGSRTIVIRGRTITLPGGGGGGSTPVFTRVVENYAFDPRAFRVPNRSGLTLINLVPSGGYGQAALARPTPERSDTLLQTGDGLLYIKMSNRTEALSVLRDNLAATKGSNSGSSSNSASASPERGLWKAVAEGKAPLIIQAANAATVLHVLAIVKEFPNVRLGLALSGTDLDLLLRADALTDHKERITVILSPTLENEDGSRVRIHAARMAIEAGLPVAFSMSQLGGSSEFTANQATPLFALGRLIAAGMSREDALRAATQTPAALLGLENTHGTLEEGRVASFLVFEGDPLEPTSTLRDVWIEGNPTHD